ncbi:MAG: adenylate cyclase, partial [Omnitrophica WOR_2 bacterium]
MKLNRMIKLGLALSLIVLVLLAPLSVALAANPPGTGQPGQDCEAIGVTPGHAASAPGSAFNPNGMAGTVYAGEQPQNSNNPNSVSQYDV